MSESQEPSYYEVALTNRQVLVSFVVLLGCVVMAFVMGVWMGKRGQLAPPPQAIETVADAGLEAGGEPYGGQGLGDESSGEGPGTSYGDEALDASAEDEATNKPDLSELGDLAQSPRPDTTLAEDLGATPPAQATPPPPRVTPPPPSTPPAQATPPPPAQATPPPPRQATPATSSGEPTEGLIIQVFSTHDEPQARKVLAQLRQGGYKAYLSPGEARGRATYRVRIGPYATRPPAEKAAKEIASKYRLETWITSAAN